MKLDQWHEQRNAALRTLDMGYARALLPHASSDEVRLMALHKARYECKDIEAELRHASGAWLRERAMGRLSGTPLLPVGELPV
jgi:hypothetical protein